MSAKCRILVVEDQPSTLVGTMDELEFEGNEVINVKSILEALATLKQEKFSLMVNEEDHLRLQGLASGLQLKEVWHLVDRLDEELGQDLAYAYHHEFGFLTSCPTNVGTGVRASVLMHLPGLVLTKEINKVLHGLSQVGLTFRGLYGEGSEVVGNFFQVSNQTTLGRTEEDLVEHL